ncbi:unnamed protein product [Paramecium sonneborni]|uniref:VLIG-type G domain-containing protein n=1 Tax=Paramecium sonneborni TaxID=65129 RepID=A0A8S1PDK6_9CILI|nr:unnamed protein product [Paramecium sonneborni]
MSICEQCIYQENRCIDIQIQQVAYMSQQKKFIILTKKSDVYFLLEDSKQIIQATCSSKNNQKPFKFHYNVNQDQIQQLLSCPSGKYFYLAQGEQCFMYDMNCQQIRTINVKGKIKIFSDQSDLIILDEIDQITQKKDLTVLTNVISQKTINKLGEEEKQIIGNPSFDILKGSFIKFGPNSLFLSESKKKQISFIIDSSKKSLIETYFNRMNLNNVNLVDTDNLHYSEISLKDLQNIMFSRVPLQLCTTENGTLIPLVDGFRQEASIQQKVSVYEKAKQLKLGFIEEYLKNDISKIFVIGIIGKQSSGKSYLLNRVFGTRFSVSSARCTDGIWASIGWIEGQKFLILDCEGLFNSARTNQEEVQMLAFLTAICDISILNSDITFNRYMNELFNNLTNASSYLKGETLFKGNLHIVLRDVSSNDNSGIDNELLSNLYRLKSSESQDIVFLKKLFNNNFTVEKLFNFEHSKFDEQIINLRQYFSKVAQASKRWEDGNKLLQMMKILLCQLELSDHGNAYLIDLKLQIEKIIENQKNLWDKFSTNHQQMIRLDQQKYQFPQGEIIFFNISLLKQLQEDLQLNDTIMNHNQNLNIMETEFNNLMTSRKEQILQQTKEQLYRFQQPEMIEIISKEEGLLANYINNQIQQYQFCKEKCSECYLNCNQFKNHIKEYDKLMNKLQTTKVALEKEIAESSIQNEDQEQQINKRLSEIIEQLQKQDFQISKFEKIIKKDEEEKQLLKCIQNLSQFEFCDTENNQLKLEAFQQSLGKDETQQQNLKLELTVENLDQLFCLIGANSKQKQQQSSKNAEVLRENKNNQKQLQNILEDVQNKIIKNDLNQKQLLDQQDQLYQKAKEFQKYIKEIDQEQQILQNNLSQVINLRIDNNNLIKQLEEISSQLQNEEKNLEFIQEQIKIQEQKKQQPCLDKFCFYNESDLFEEFQEIRKEKEMILQEIDKLQKQKEKLHKLESMKQEQANMSVKKQKEKEKYENDLKISIQSDLTKKKNEIELNLQLYQQQLNKQKFEDLEIFEEIINKESQNISSDSLKKNTYHQFLNFKKAEEKDSEEELQNLYIQFQKTEQNIKNLAKAQEQIFKYQNIQNCKIEAENSLSENQKELVKINEQNRFIVIEQETLKRNMQEANIQNDLLNTNNNKLINENEQIEKALQNNEQWKEQISECLKILYIIDESKQIAMLQEFEECKQYQQLQNSDLTYTKQCQLLKDEKETLLKEKQELDQRIQLYFQVGEGKQQLKELLNQIQKLEKLQGNVHSCQRQSHLCEEKCQACPDKSCNHKAGHDEKQEHLCSKLDHICDMNCSVQDCQNKCKNIRNHSGNHTCNNKHICKKICDYCDKQCQYDKTEIHQSHICLDKNNGCNQECELCDKNCKEQHQHSIKSGTYCEKKCSKHHQHQRQPTGTHLCNDIHYCKETCTKQGICNVEYESVQATWKSKISEFQYTKYIPKNGGKKKCMHQIPKGKYNHDQEHVCMRDTDFQYHFCDQKCPECQSFCELKYDHKGLHYSSKHRNKDDQKFTLQKGKKNQIKVVSEDGKTVKNYVVGDVSSPETCRESCKRRGRGHFHLIECKGGQQCLEKSEQKRYARHSQQKYLGFEFQKFDEILCFQFWELKMWAHPLQNTEDIDIIQSCDAYCPLCQNNKSFCEERGWHTHSDKIKDHKFPCSLNHQQDIFHGIDVAFVIDTTESMSKYIKSCIEIIKKTMQNFQKFKKHLNQCQFAIVSYKDHTFPYDVNQQIIQVQNFASEDVINQFLESLQAQGGDDYPEALLDGLNASIKLNWNEKNIKIIYLIADAPPHGNNDNKKQTKYHSFKDSFPDGCPCGLKQKEILEQFQQLNIQLKIVKLNSTLEMMISNFKEEYQNLIELTPQNMDYGYLQISGTQRNYISIQIMSLPVKNIEFKIYNQY